MALSRIKTWIAEVLYAADLNAEFNNILNNALSLISPLTGNLDAGANRLTNIGVPTALTDAMRLGDSISNLGTYYTTAGTQPTYTLTPSPAITAYAAGQAFLVKIHSANAGGAATLNVSALGAKNIYYADGATAMIASDLALNAIYFMIYDGTQFRALRIPNKVVGTWTPAITLGGGSVTHTLQKGFYWSLDDLVWFTLTITISGSTTPSGQLSINLPHTPVTTDQNTACSVSYAPGTTQFLLGASTGLIPAQFSIVPGTAALIGKSIQQSNGAVADIGANVVNLTSGITVTGSYRK